MGNYFSSASSSDGNQIAGLEKRLMDLENIDRDNDGVVSRDEMELWMNKQKKDIEDLKNAIESDLNEKYGKIIAEKDEYKNQVTELKKQVVSLESINGNLRKELQETKNFATTDKAELAARQKAKLSELSKERINQVVEDLLNDKNVNIKYLPDFVEKQIYRNVFNIMINLLDNVLETTSVQFLGHNLTFDINPQSESEQSSTQGSEDDTHDGEGSEKKRRRHRKHRKE